MISKFEDAVLRLFYPTTEERLPADTSSEDNFFRESEDVLSVEIGEQAAEQPLSVPEVDAPEGGDEKGSTSPIASALSRAQRKRLRRRIHIQETAAKRKRFIGPRLPCLDDTAEPSKQSEMDANEKHGTQCVVPPGIKQGSDDVGGAVVMSKTQRRRLAKKQNGGHPASLKQGTAFVVDVVGQGVVFKHLN